MVRLLVEDFSDAAAAALTLLIRSLMLPKFATARTLFRNVKGV